MYYIILNLITMKKNEKFVLNENAEILDDKKMELLIGGGHIYHFRCERVNYNNCYFDIEGDFICLHLNY